MAYTRYKFENFFVTTMADDHTLTPSVDWTLPLVSVPTTIEEGKIFFVVINVNNISNRIVLPVYMDSWLVKYKWYNIKTVLELHKYDDVALNDVAEAFNTLFELTDDIGKVVQKTGLDIFVYGWDVVIGNSQYAIPDTEISLTDNSTNFIVLDYADQEIKSVTTLPEAYYQFATIITLGGAITSLVRKRAFNVQDFFSALFFEKDTNGEVIIKDWAIKWLNLDFTSFDSDDIEEGWLHLFLTQQEAQEIEANTSARHTHSNKSLLDSYDQSNTDIEDAISKKHTHTNKVVLDLIPDISWGAEWDVLVKVGNTIQRWPSGGGSGGTTTAWVDVFIWDWISNTFVLSHTPLNDNFIFMTNDSGQNYYNTIDYSRNGNTITLSQIPDLWRNIYVRYFQQINIAQVGETNTMANLAWAWIGVYKQKSGVEFQMRRVRWINGISVIQQWDEIVIDGLVQVWPWGEANTASNVWAGVGLFKLKSWVDLQFKTILSSPTIEVSENDDEIIYNINQDNLDKRYYRHRMY